MSYEEMPLAISLSPILPARTKRWIMGDMASPAPIYSSIYCSREFSWYPFYLRADDVPGWGGGGRREALEARHTFFSAL